MRFGAKTRQQKKFWEERVPIEEEEEEIEIPGSK